MNFAIICSLDPFFSPQEPKESENWDLYFFEDLQKYLFYK